MTTPLLVEVITLPVSDVDRALRFYVDQVSFALDVDYARQTTSASFSSRRQDQAARYSRALQERGFRPR